MGAENLCEGRNGAGPVTGREARLGEGFLCRAADLAAAPERCGLGQELGGLLREERLGPQPETHKREPRALRRGVAAEGGPSIGVEGGDLLAPGLRDLAEKEVERAAIGDLGMVFEPHGEIVCLAPELVLDGISKKAGQGLRAQDRRQGVQGLYGAGQSLVRMVGFRRLEKVEQRSERPVRRQIGGGALAGLSEDMCDAAKRVAAQAVALARDGGAAKEGERIGMKPLRDVQCGEVESGACVRFTLPGQLRDQAGPRLDEIGGPEGRKAEVRDRRDNGDVRGGGRSAWTGRRRAWIGKRVRARRGRERRCNVGKGSKYRLGVGRLTGMGGLRSGRFARVSASPGKAPGPPAEGRVSPGTSCFCGSGCAIPGT